MGPAGKVYQTRGITALPPDDQSAIRETVCMIEEFLDEENAGEEEGAATAGKR
jgi:hypothetical protein